MGELSFTHIEGSGLFFEHDCMVTWASSWQTGEGGAQGEQRITHGYFYGPGPEVAHITSAHILLALFSREVEKWGLAVSTRRAGYESGCIHAY